MLAVAVVTSGCAKSASSSIGSAPSEVVVQTPALAGSWQPISLVPQAAGKQPAMLQVLTLVSDGKLSAFTSAGPPPSSGTWSIEKPGELRLTLDAGGSSRSGLYRFAQSHDQLKLQWLQGDQWATGLGSTTALYQRMR